MRHCRNNSAILGMNKMKRPIVFSLFRDQSVFMTAVMGIMTFLAVMALGISLAIGTGVMRWNRQWDTFATIQVTNADNVKAVRGVLNENRDKIESMRELSNDEMAELMRPWISGAGNGALMKYLPTMFEVKFKTDADMRGMADSVKKNARFITHNDALKPSVSAGWKMVAILAVVLGLIIATIGICVSFIARNTAILHKRELEILNQVGASDSFVVRQMQTIVMRICVVACGAGFLAAVPILAIILMVAHSARVGLMAMLAISGAGWCTLILMPIAIILFAIVVTKRTTLKILNNEQ